MLQISVTGPHGRMGTAAQSLLIDDDGHAQIFDGIRFGLGIARQEVADEQTVVFVEQSLSFVGDGMKHERRFLGTGNTGKYRDLAFGNAQRHVLQIVRARRGSQCTPGA